MTVISLCDRTGNMVRPWADAGYPCLCLDLEHSIRADRVDGPITYRWADVRSVVRDELPAPTIIFAFPPCTNLAVSGARDFQRKGLRGMIDALEVVESCRMLCEAFGVPWMLENPVSRLSSSWRKPDHLFHPYEYGDGYTKKTCLWVGNGFVMPPTTPVAIDRPDYIHHLGGSRSTERSVTPMGFARAVFHANAPRLSREAA